MTKLYDARTNGGFFDVPPPALCAASDECHGPGTRRRRPPPIGTIAGTPGNSAAKEDCKKGFVKKHGQVREEASKEEAQEAPPSPTQAQLSDR